MNCFVIRGAITVENNTKEEIIEGTKVLVGKILESNKIINEEVIQILFTATRDLDQAYPAVGARDLGLCDAALMCMQELYVEGSLPKCIRVAIMCQNDKRSQQTVKHCYLRDAQKLRPDLLTQ